MTPLTDFRALVRRDLRDEDALAYRWTDNEIDRAMSRALEEYSLASPRQQKTTKATTAGSRIISLSSGFTDLIKIYRVEFPIDQHPPRYQRFEVWKAEMRLLGDDEGNGNNCYIYWGSKHAIDGTENSVETEHLAIVARGAAAFAATSAAQGAVDTINTGGADVDRDYQAWGAQELKYFYGALKAIRRQLSVNTMFNGRLFYEQE
jgi:hypothetical protein